MSSEGHLNLGLFFDLMHGTEGRKNRRNLRRKTKANSGRKQGVKFEPIRLLTPDAYSRSQVVRSPSPGGLMHEDSSPIIPSAGDVSPADAIMAEWEPPADRHDRQASGAATCDYDTCSHRSQPRPNPDLLDESVTMNAESINMLPSGGYDGSVRAQPGASHGLSAVSMLAKCRLYD